MATLAPPPPKTEKEELERGGGFGDHGSRGGGDDGSPGGGDSVLPGRRYYTGMLLALAGITMFFTAFTSAYVIRKGLGSDWQATRLPAILWWNTAVLLASSLTLEKGRRSRWDLTAFRSWWSATTVLGMAFLIGQVVAWRQLAAQGVYMSTNASSSFFYLLTGAHGVHLLGGVLALAYVLVKAWPRLEVAGPAALGVTALYWHFMDGLWIYLFLLLLLWR